MFPTKLTKDFFNRTILTSEEITNSTPSTAAQLLEGEGKVYVQKSQHGGGSPVIRGLKQTVFS